MIKELYIERSVADSPAAADISARLGLSPTVVADARTVYERVCTARDPIGAGKQTLLLTRNRGAFIRSCPGTRAYTCCGYQILHIGTFCTMDCSYCILQAYFHPPLLQFFLNHGDMIRDLDRLFTQPKIARVGTGEFTDSLIWERWTDISRQLVTHFGAQQRAVLELKTKTTAVEGFAHLAHRHKTILAWSLNTERVIHGEERGSASLSARIEAAARCAQWGYPLAFHFDPMVIYDGCEEDYRQVISRLFERVPSERVVWISLGTFRFMPGLKPIITRRFLDSKILYGEFISGLDGKMRYFKPLRIALYRKAAAWLREAAPGVRIYFCMEDDEVWDRSLGFTPQALGGLPRMLDESAARHCGVRGEMS
jgi:spore photoproduct lyase